MAEIKTIEEAFFDLQQDLYTIELEKDSTNPHYKSKYASLPYLLKQIMPTVFKHKFSLRHESAGKELIIVLTYVPTREQIRGTLEILSADNKTQSVMSAISYTRRYSITSLFELLIPDDDGNGANGEPEVKPEKAENPTELKDGDEIAIGGQKYIYKNSVSKAGKAYEGLQDPNKKDTKNPKYNRMYFSTSDIFTALMDQWKREQESEVDPNDIPDFN